MAVPTDQADVHKGSANANNGKQPLHPHRLTRYHSKAPLGALPLPILRLQQKECKCFSPAALQAASPKHKPYQLKQPPVHNTGTCISTRRKLQDVPPPHKSSHSVRCSFLNNKKCGTHRAAKGNHDRAMPTQHAGHTISSSSARRALRSSSALRWSPRVLGSLPLAASDMLLAKPGNSPGTLSPNLNGGGRTKPGNNR